MHTVRTAAVVIGGGPAGLGLAAELCAHGIHVTLVDPAPLSPWPNTYCSWIDEDPWNDFEQVWAHQWSQPQVRLDSEHCVTLDRSYGMLDSESLQAQLLARAGERLETVQGTVVDASATHVVLESGDRVAGDVVFDASGGTYFRECPEPSVWQIAFGATVHVRHGLPLDTCDFMDWRDGQLCPPTFAYVLPLSETEVFVEETVLMTRKDVSMDWLESGLRGRLAQRGWGGADVSGIERCRFPMDIARPSRGEGPVPVGQAGGMVHPATGYSVARTLRTARRIAEALMARPTTEWAAAGWRAAHPPNSALCDALYRYGQETVLAQSREETIRFFDRFFALPAHHQKAYLAGDAPMQDIASAMWSLFLRAPSQLQWMLARNGFQPTGRRLLREAAVHLGGGW